MDKAVIVTGAAGTIGSAVARAFGKAGDKVLVSDIDAAPLGELVAEMNKGPGEAVARPADIRYYDQVRTMVYEVLNRWKKLDVIACIAGQSLARLSKERKSKLIIEHTDADWDLVMETNLKGTFHCVKAVAGPFMAQKDGHIIIMGSGTGSRGGMRVSSYATVKSGLLGLLRSAAIELGTYNIKVNVIFPGRILHPGDVLDERNIEETTLHRVNDVGEVADFFVYLSGMKNVSGQVFNLDSRIIF